MSTPRLSDLFEHAEFRCASGDNGGDCVEVAVIGTAAAVRDSKWPAAGLLHTSAVAVRDLITGIKVGAFDDLLV